MPLPLRYYGDPIFRVKGKPIAEIDNSIRTFVRNLIETMDANGAIGLAAHQAGEAIQLFVLHNSIPLPDGTSILSDPLVFINPRVLSKSPKRVLDWEASPSIPGVQEQVERSFAITVEAMNLEGEMFVDHSEGLNARVRQHEKDHLDGILFTDHLSLKVKKRIEPVLKQIQSSRRI